MMTIDSAMAPAPEGASSAQVIETHCATLFFSGERVYKVKKPLDLGFVDFRSPASRRRACRRELELPGLPAKPFRAPCACSLHGHITRAGELNRDRDSHRKGD